MSETLKTFLASIAEKALKTFAQTLLLFLAVGFSAFDASWGTILQASALATVVTVLTALVQSSWTSSNQYVEIAARAARTFLASLVGAIPVVDASHAFTFSDVNWSGAASVAAGAAVISLLTSAASLRLGPPNTPSLVREVSGRHRAISE